MPRAPLRVHTCGELVPAGEKCKRCLSTTRRLVDQERGSAARRGYDARWRQARQIWLAAHPFCADPFGEHGAFPVMATEVDHIEPHRGDPVKFWDTSNWQSLCRRCHARKTASETWGVGKDGER